MGGKAIEAADRLAGGHPQAAQYPLPDTPHGEAGTARGPEHEAVAQSAAVGEFRGCAAADQGNGSLGGLELPGHRFHRLPDGSDGQHQGRCLDCGEAIRKECGQSFEDRHGHIEVAGTAAAHPAGAGTAGFALGDWLWLESGAGGGIGDGSHRSRSPLNEEEIMKGVNRRCRNRRSSAPAAGWITPAQLSRRRNWPQAASWSRPRLVRTLTAVWRRARAVRKASTAAGEGRWNSSSSMGL
jgi:hypothetical protein